MAERQGGGQLTPPPGRLCYENDVVPFRVNPKEPKGKIITLMPKGGSDGPPLAIGNRLTDSKNESILWKYIQNTLKKCN